MSVGRLTMIEIIKWISIVGVTNIMLAMFKFMSGEFPQFPSLTRTAYFTI